jgi:hypothetical protein
MSANITPFDDPPAELRDGMIGWRYESEPDPADAGKWRPRAWTIVYPDHVLEVDYRTRLAMRDSTLHVLEATP